MNYLAKASRSVVEYFQGAYEEFRRVTWPTQQMMMTYTMLVIATIVAASLFLMAFDYGMQQLVNKFIIR